MPIIEEILTNAEVCANTSIDSNNKISASNFHDYNGRSVETNLRYITIADPSERYFLLTYPLYGGLNNQIISLFTAIEFAMKYNRTLILPQLRTNFPTESCAKMTHYKNIFDLELLLSISESYGVRILSDLPVGIEHLPISFFWSWPEALANISMKVLHDQPVVATAIVLMAPGTHIYRKYIELNNHGLSLYRKCMLHLIGKSNINTILSRNNSIVSNNADLSMRAINSIMTSYFDGESNILVAVHMRIERDWYNWAKIKKFRDLMFYDAQEIIKLITESNFFQELFSNDMGNRSITILLSYASDLLIAQSGNPTVGWPNNIRIVPTNEIDILLRGEDYITSSYILFELCSQANYFIGLTRNSSFSQAVGALRMSTAPIKGTWDYSNGKLIELNSIPELGNVRKIKKF